MQVELHGAKTIQTIPEEVTKMNLAEVAAHLIEAKATAIETRVPEAVTKILVKVADPKIELLIEDMGQDLATEGQIDQIEDLKIVMGRAAKDPIEVTSPGLRLQSDILLMVKVDRRDLLSRGEIMKMARADTPRILAQGGIMMTVQEEDTIEATTMFLAETQKEVGSKALGTSMPLL